MEGETDWILLSVVGFVGLVAVVAMGLSATASYHPSAQPTDSVEYALGVEPVHKTSPVKRDVNAYKNIAIESEPSRVSYLLAP